MRCILKCRTVVLCEIHDHDSFLRASVFGSTWPPAYLRNDGSSVDVCEPFSKLLWCENNGLEWVAIIHCWSTLSIILARLCWSTVFAQVDQDAHLLKMQSSLLSWHTARNSSVVSLRPLAWSINVLGPAHTVCVPLPPSRVQWRGRREARTHTWSSSSMHLFHQN